MTLVTVHVQCAASENIHTHPIPWKVSGNFEGVGGGGGGVSKAKILKGLYGA